MDYEKKYNEALAHARQAYGTGAYDDATLEAIFPELRESEDERIRLQLSDFLEHLHSQGKEMDFDVWCKADCANWIIWLEKHKINTEGDFARGYDCGYECCLNSHGAEWFEKQKEIRDPFDDEQFCRGYEAGKRDAEREQKPVGWSEEDEKMLANLRSTLSNLSVRGLIKKVTEQKYSAWLKSLRPQKKEDSPKWLVDEDYDEKIDGKDFSLHPVGLAYRGFYIPYSDLLKLPREDEK